MFHMPMDPRRALWIAVTAAAWFASTVVFWVGYTGEDDLFYSRYAYLMHRPPMVWWEFRMPAILAFRTSFLLLGPTEFAAALPSLLASAAILASVSWFVDWPRTLTWQSQGAVLLAAFIPIDVGFRSYPSANQVAAGLLAMGTVCILKGRRRTQTAGSALLAVAFLAHEISFFYIAIFCVIALLFDARRFWRPVAWCVALSGALFLAECAAYQVWLGDAFVRFKTAAGTTSQLQTGVDVGTGLKGLRFYLWPVQNFILGKSFGFDLLALFVTGIVAWRHLTREQQILFTTTFAVYFWLGYGSQVPWAYKPLYRQAHYYNCLSVGVAALLPCTVGLALNRRARAGQAVVGAAIAVHIGTLAVTGGWGADVDVSRRLLDYARQHPQQRFVTDVNTINQIYVLGGFRLPDNIVCVNGNAVTKHLLLNKEPADVSRYRFPEGAVDGVMVNLERRSRQGFEPEFTSYFTTHPGTHTTIAPPRYRMLFRPFVGFVAPRSFMVRSLGGEVVHAQP